MSREEASARVRPQRHFFALWPDAPAARALEALGDCLAARCGGKAVPAAKIHLTLAFLGDIGAERVEEAAAAGASIETVPFDVAFDTIGWFRGAKVAWAGCANPAPGLLALHRRLDEALRRRRFVLESRPYTPHLTLVRKASRPVPDRKSVV